MAVNKEKIYEKALNLIEKKRLIYIEDIVAYLPISKETFYKYFHVGSDELDAIKEKIDENKVNLKVGLRRKMFESRNTADRIALYKLVCTDEERKRLSQSYIDHTSDGERISTDVFSIEIVDASEQDDTDS